MREILFRGKRVGNGEWVFGSYVIQYGAHEIYLPDGVDSEHGFDRYHVIPETVGQYTGLTDKNGRKIFEGDIMRNAGNVVEFYGGDFCINGDSPLSYWTGTEVIGNIYDNPELLKGGNDNG